MKLYSNLRSNELCRGVKDLNCSRLRRGDIVNLSFRSKLIMNQEMGLVASSLPYARSKIQDILSVKLAMVHIQRALPYLDVRNSGEFYV